MLAPGRVVVRVRPDIALGTFKFPFEIGSSRNTGEGQPQKQTAVTILLTHIACTAQAHAKSSRTPGFRDSEERSPLPREQAAAELPF